MEQHHDLRIVNSFGVGTGRYCSCWPSSLSSSIKSDRRQDHQADDSPPATTEDRSPRVYVDVPLGSSIVRWDVDRQARVKFFRPHSDIVTCMLKAEGFTFTASEAGEVAIWDEDWNLLDRSHHSRKVKVTHAAVSPCRRRIVTTSEHDGGVVTLFKVYRDDEADGGLRLVKQSEFGEGADYTFAEWADDEGSLLVAVRQPPRSSRHTVPSSPSPSPSPPPSLHHHHASTSDASDRADRPRAMQTALHLINVDHRSGEWRVVKERPLEPLLPSSSSSSSSSSVVRSTTGISVSAVAKEEEEADPLYPPSDAGAFADEGSLRPRMAIALGGRQVEVVDMRTLATLWRIDASGGSGLIKCLAFKSGGRLLCPGDNARLTVWHRDRLEGEFALDGMFAFHMFARSLRCMPDARGSIYYINSDDALKEAWVVNEAGIHSCPLIPRRHPGPVQVREDTAEGTETRVSRHMAFHGMTCCGTRLDFNAEGTQVAVGDFAGNVIVWDVSSHLPLASTRVPSLLPVRSICWRRPSDPSSRRGSSPHVLMGTVSGEVYSWNPFRSGAPVLVASLGDTVTCMRWEHGDSPRLLAAATTGGTLHVLKLVHHDPSGREDDAAPSFEEALAFRAHQPVAGPQNLQFGSIGLFAEIWSLAWSPDNAAIATCSEDQQTCLWSLRGEKLRTLTGHTTAVTGVDWQRMRMRPSGVDRSTTENEGKNEDEEFHDEELLATCADDRKVMVWDARTWELVNVFDTSDDIHEWHTLTYLALQSRGDKLCCVTQNGAVAVWDSVGAPGRGRRRWVGKLHAGSVEGLAWSPASDLLATCSSDCTIHLLRHDHPAAPSFL